MPLPVLSVARFASPVAILAAVVVLWMRFNASPPKRGLYPLDLINYFYPLGQEVAHRLSSGELPLWNPYICGGVPLLASPQVAVFYPGTWLSLLLPTHLAIPARMFAECVLGGCFIALLLRTWELGAFAATCGATIFVFACLLGQTFWPPEVSAIIWLPWLLTCVEKLVVQWRWRWWCGFVVGTSLQLLAGFPQFVVYTFYLLGPYAMVRSAEVALRSRRPGATALRIFGLLVGVGLAAGIASVQLLPTIELMQQSQRASPLSQREVHYAHRVTPRGVAVLQRVLDPSPKLMTFDLGQGSGYVGIPTLIMLSVGIVAGYRRPLLWLLLLVGVVAFLLSDGYRGWGGHLYGLYAALPTGALFRTPERFRLLTLFGAIAVASMGFDRFDRGIHSRRQPAIALPVVVAVSTAVVITLLGPPAAAWRAVVTAALFFLAVVWGRWRSVRLTCQAGMFLLLLGDLAHATGPFGSLRAFPSAWAERLSLSGHTVMDDQSFAELSRELGLDRVAFHGLQPAIGAGPIGKVQRVDCREVLIPRSWARLRGGSGIDRYSRSLYDVASVREVFHADVSSSPELAAKTLLGGDVVYREHAEPLPGPPPGITLQRVTNHDALPRAYLADRFAVMSAEEALEHVNAGDVDFHGLVLLDREPEVTVAARSDGRFVPATITSYAPERVEIAVDAPAPAILVLTDSFYPGWHVRVNGASRQIIRANGHFRAVAVPAGRHDVVFEYRPASLRLGAAVYVLSLLILGLSSLLHARSRWLASM